MTQPGLSQSGPSASAQPATGVPTISEAFDGSEPEHAYQAVRDLLATQWSAGDRSGFFGTLGSDFRDIVVRHILKQFWSLSCEDAEDCFSEAIDGFIRHVERFESDPTIPCESVYKIVRNPAAYVWTSAVHAAESMVTERKIAPDGTTSLRDAYGALMSVRGGVRERVPDNYSEDGEAVGDVRRRAQRDDSHDAGESAPVSDDLVGADLTAKALDVVIPAAAALNLAEALLDADEEVDPTHVREAVQLAVSRLSPPLQQVANYLLRMAEPKSTEAAVDLGIAASTFRKRKERMYQALRESLPGILSELGASPRITAALDVGLNNQQPRLDRGDHEDAKSEEAQELADLAYFGSRPL